MRHYITALPIALASIILLTSGQAKAHEGDPNVVIHVFENGETYENCSFMIHPSLTQGEFHRFTREAGGIIYFQPLTSASTLGKYKFNVGLAMSKTPSIKLLVRGITPLLTPSLKLMKPHIIWVIRSIFRTFA